MILFVGIVAIFTPAKAQTIQEVIPESIQEMITRIAVAYGQNPKTAIAIAKCEGIAYKTTGNHKNYRKGKLWSTDIGIFQINNVYHQSDAKKMGLDIMTDRGNIVYAMWLMKNEGTKPWSASARCQKKLV